MGALHLAEWAKIPISLSELCINTTLRCGQSFRYMIISYTLARRFTNQCRWRKSEAGVWSMALHGRIIALYQDHDNLYYKNIHAHDDTTRKDYTSALLKHYLNLGPNLADLYSQWSAADANFARKAPNFTGVRVLKQDAWEALVGFICSSNNNIVRISQMVSKLCANYGPLLGTFEDAAYHDFPSPKELAKDGVEHKLRELGFGYRAKYIYQTACMVAEREDGWLDTLRNPESPVFGEDPKSAGKWSESGREGYRTAHEQLLTLQGVGPKVADCVCLMGLGWGEAVPVDTHGKSYESAPCIASTDTRTVWQIAQRDYKFGRGKHSSLTKATYDAVGDKFRTLWGQEAGWAHSVLFTADLKAFAERLVVRSEEKMQIIKQEDDTVVGALTEDTVQDVKQEIGQATQPAKRKRKTADDVENDNKENVVGTAGKRRTRNSMG